MTNQRRAETEARHALKHFEMVMQHIPAIVERYTTTEGFEYLSSAPVFDVDAAKCYEDDGHWVTTIHPADRRSCRAADRRGRAGGHAVPFAEAAARRHGRVPLGAVECWEAELDGAVRRADLVRNRPVDVTTEKEAEEEIAKLRSDLSEREFEVLELLGLGLTNSDIANELFISRAHGRPPCLGGAAEVGFSQQDRGGHLDCAVEVRRQGSRGDGHRATPPEPSAITRRNAAAQARQAAAAARGRTPDARPPAPER